MFPDPLASAVDRMLNGLLRCFRRGTEAGKLMIVRMVIAVTLLSLPCALSATRLAAQDVPGIEICTVEKTMERRTSCLQSNVDFLQKTITRLGIDHQQKIDAAKAQIEALRATVAGLQKRLEEAQAAQKKPVEDQKKAEPPPAQDAAKGATK